MADFNARKIIEALRSGVPSREVGRCFSSARPRLIRELDGALNAVADERVSSGMIFTGKYGEGKTHLLNTVIGMAAEKNMVVSILSLSKETLLYKLHALYPKIIQSTYLPGRVQPGFARVFEEMTPNSPVAASMFEYALTALETDKLYYLLKSYLGTGDDEEKFRLLADFEGDFVLNNDLKKAYRRILGERAAFKTAFSKTKHTMDYLAFLSHLFLTLGYKGWVILFDEAELIGRLGKKARLNAYANITRLIQPKALEAVFCLFAFNASYIPDVIEGKHEFANLDAAQLAPEVKQDILSALNRITAAPQLVPLNREEILEILEGVQRFHAQAYDWNPNLEPPLLLSAVEQASGQLLRAKIRTAIELLDQLYQYGKVGDIRINELGQATYEEDLVPLDADVLDPPDEARERPAGMG
ncbi:MAG: ATP-binding protein [Clostridiales bacterium]|jgi:hypothetical protein|nr:ATP-binding protein [Clostridiales bacterium]